MGVSTAFPIVASCRALQAYNASLLWSKSRAAPSLTLPLDYLLHKVSAAGFAALPAEDAARFRAANASLRSLHMWLIYWICFAAMLSAERLFMLDRILPGYSIFKTAALLWLMRPIVFSRLDTDDNADSFSRNGLGLVYYSYILPFVEAAQDYVCNLDLASVLPRTMSLFTSMQLALSVPQPHDDESAWALPRAALSYLNFAPPFASPAPEPAQDSSPAASSLSDRSYVVIDKSSVAIEDHERDRAQSADIQVFETQAGLAPKSKLRWW